MTDDTNTDTPQRASEQFDLTRGMDFDVSVGDLYGLATDLADAESFDPDDADAETLAEFVAALKELSDAVETARKDVFEPALGERVDVDGDVGPLVRREGSRGYVTDESGAIEAIAEAGGDPTDAMTLKATDAATAMDDLGIDADQFLGATTYTYFRRQQ